MRKLLALLIFCVSLLPGVGSVQQAGGKLGSTDNFFLTFTWTGDAINGTVPITRAQFSLFSPVSVQGFRILQIETAPGSPTPTNSYSVQLIDSFNGDILGGVAGVLSSTLVQFWAPSSGTPPITGAFSLKITGQNVASATGSVTVYLGPVLIINGQAGLTGPPGPQGPPGPGGTGSATVLYAVSSCGAVADALPAGTGTDSTAALQACINTLKAAGGGTLWLDTGAFLVSRLDLTGTANITIRGTGLNSSVLLPKAGTASYGTSTGHMLDTTGSRAIKFIDLTIGQYNQTPCPTTAVLLAAANVNGLRDSINFDNVYISGCYTQATVYVYGVTSSAAVNSRFYNYRTGTTYVWQMAGDNVAALASSFATIAAGSQGVSDWEFIACEFHHFSNNASGTPINLGVANAGQSAYTFVGGNISSSGTQGQYVTVTGNNSFVTWRGVTFYSDLGTPPTNVFSVSGGSTLSDFDIASSNFQPGSTLFAGAGTFNPTYAAVPLHNHSNSGAVIVGGSTVFLGFVGHDANELNAIQNIGLRSMVCNLQLFSTSSPGGGQTYTATLRKNQTDTAATCQISGAGVSCQDATHCIQFNSADLIDTRVVLSGAANSSGFSATFGALPY